MANRQSDWTCVTPLTNKVWRLLVFWRWSRRIGSARDVWGGSSVTEWLHYGWNVGQRSGFRLLSRARVGKQRWLTGKPSSPVQASFPLPLLFSISPAQTQQIQDFSRKKPLAFWGQKDWVFQWFLAPSIRGLGSFVRAFSMQHEGGWSPKNSFLLCCPHGCHPPPTPLAINPPSICATHPPPP